LSNSTSVVVRWRVGDVWADVAHTEEAGSAC